MAVIVARSGRWNATDHGPFTLAGLLSSGVRRLVCRRWPLVVTGLLLITGMAYSMLWAPVVRHHSYWITPGDLWGAYRSAHYIGWGYLGGVYSAGTWLVTFPGLLLVLAPVAMLTGALGLTESFPWTVAHPTAWLLLGPVEILLCALALFATDALAERIGVTRQRRMFLCLAEGVLLWNVTAWGHPEDAVAVAFAIYALVLALDGRWTGAGWLFGAAMVTQPLVLLMFPVLMAMAGKQMMKGLIVRSVLPIMLLMATPLISQFHPTIHAILDQPNFPGVDHSTPWTVLAPRISGHGKSLIVAGGPGRVVAFVLACALGVWARRWRDRPEILVWAAALAMALRCFTESVMDSYYIWPALAIGLVAVSGRLSRVQIVFAAGIAVLTTVVSDWRLGELPWWLLITTGIVVVLASGKIGRLSRERLVVPMNIGDSKSNFEMKFQPLGFDRAAIGRATG